MSDSGSGAAAAAPGSSGGLANLNFGGSGPGDGNAANAGVGVSTGDTCAADISTAKPIPLDMYLMLDVSGSMLDPTAATTSKWDAVKAALEAFLKDQDSAGLGVGLQYFPLTKPNAPTSCASNADCGDSSPCLLKGCGNYLGSNVLPCEANSDCIDPQANDYVGPCVALGQCSGNTTYVCFNQGAPCEDGTGKDFGTCGKLVSSVCENTESCDVAVYAAPASPIAALPDAAAGLLASIDAKVPSGNTPTAPALSGAVKQASSWATAHPDHRVITVLATDGLPTECTPTAIGSVAAIAQAGLASTPSISTFVIGVFGPDDVKLGAPDNLNQIAAQGGTKAAFIIDTQKDVTAQFLTALDTIRGARLSCEFQIPQPAATQTLNYDLVNVLFTNGGLKSNVFFVKNAAACDAASGGWYYDVDPAAGSPTKIIACPTSCSAFQGAPSGSSVGIALGCKTIVK